MKKNLGIFVLGCVIVIVSCDSVKKTSEEHIFRIDSTIKIVAQKEIWNSEYKKPKYGFATKLTAEFFENDTLTDLYQDSIDNTFSASYSWHNDTLKLTGNIGDLTQTGFAADIYKDSTAVIYHNQCSHSHKQYKLKLSDTLVQCIKVPCTYSELYLSNFPDKTKDEEIYGYITFKSENFYYQNGQENSKLRANMKFYFRAFNYDMFYNLYLKKFESK